MDALALAIGNQVKASYKTGIYIGTIVEAPGLHKVAVCVQSVIKHPTQGDLHHPMEDRVAFFHERRALSEKEIALMPIETVELYSGSIPDYRLSLKQAVTNEISEMEQLLVHPTYATWAKKCIEQLNQLVVEYAFS